MKLPSLLIAGALVLGVLCGPAVLAAAAESRPPIEWSHLEFVFLASLMGGVWFMGMSLVSARPDSSHSALRFLGPLSLWLVSSGASALGTAALRGPVPAHAYLFLLVGLGLLLPVLGTFVLRRWRYKHVDSREPAQRPRRLVATLVGVLAMCVLIGGLGQWWITGSEAYELGREAVGSRLNVRPESVGLKWLASFSFSDGPSSGHANFVLCGPRDACFNVVARKRDAQWSLVEVVER